MKNHKDESQFNLPPNNISKKVHKRAKKCRIIAETPVRKQKEFSKQREC